MGASDTLARVKESIVTPCVHATRACIRGHTAVEAGWWLSGHQEVFNRKPEAAAEVSDDVLRRIRKALDLGLHPGGYQCEKDQAMRRATKLMQSYGLSRAGASSVPCV